MISGKKFTDGSGKDAKALLIDEPVLWAFFQLGQEIVREKLLEVSNIFFVVRHTTVGGQLQKISQDWPIGQLTKQSLVRGQFFELLGILCAQGTEKFHHVTIFVEVLGIDQWQCVREFIPVEQSDNFVECQIVL